MKTFAYVDGFNLYYRALRSTSWKWLDLDALLKRIFPKNEFERIRYFTAKVKNHHWDPDQRTRQEVYLRALRTLGNLQIHYGHFTRHRTTMPLAGKPRGRPQFVEVVKTEEKGSDVNLASHLVNDAHKAEFDVAIVVTNDSRPARETIRTTCHLEHRHAGIGVHPRVDRTARPPGRRDACPTIRGIIDAREFVAQPSRLPGGWVVVSLGTTASEAPLVTAMLRAEPEAGRIPSRQALAFQVRR